MKLKSCIFFWLLWISLTSCVAQANRPFRFALLTDLHVTHQGTALEDLQQSVDQINQSADIEFVLVTGDITEEGDHQSLQRAKDVLDQLKVDYYIIPGNHETKWSESGVTDFEKIFGSERFKFQHNDCLFLGFNTGPVMRMADGHVVPQDIAWMEDELKQAGCEKSVFLVTHYPLLKQDVDNWYEVTDLVRPYRIQAFLGGHYHKNELFDYDGIPGIIHRSNLRGKEAVGGYSILDVTADSLIVFEHRIGEKPMKWLSIPLLKENNRNYSPIEIGRSHV